MVEIYTVTLIGEFQGKFPTLHLQEKGTAMAIMKTFNDIVGKELEWDFKCVEVLSHEEALDQMITGHHLLIDNRHSNNGN